MSSPSDDTGIQPEDEGQLGGTGDVADGAAIASGAGVDGTEDTLVVEEHSGDAQPDLVLELARAEAERDAAVAALDKQGRQGPARPEGAPVPWSPRSSWSSASCCPSPMSSRGPTTRCSTPTASCTPSGQSGPIPAVTAAVSTELTNEIFNSLNPQQIIANSLPPKASFPGGTRDQRSEGLRRRRPSPRCCSPANSRRCGISPSDLPTPSCWRCSRATATRRSQPAMARWCSTSSRCSTRRCRVCRVSSRAWWASPSPCRPSPRARCPAPLADRSPRPWAGRSRPPVGRSRSSRPSSSKTPAGRYEFSTGSRCCCSSSPRSWRLWRCGCRGAVAGPCCNSAPGACLAWS